MQGVGGLVDQGLGGFGVKVSGFQLGWAWVNRFKFIRYRV